MRNKNSIPQRWYGETWSDLEKAFEERVKRGLMKPKEMKSTKMTELMRKTSSWKILLNELKNKPEGKERI